MKFSYDAYKALLFLLKSQNYEIKDYATWQTADRCVILRHDIDNDIEKATRLAQVEQQCGAKSTYFVLLTSDFYNVFSANSQRKLQKILQCGHDIGLHFDEMRYPDLVGNIEKLQEKILQEMCLLETAIGKPVTAVSMHRPSKQMLEANIQLPGGGFNSYSKVFFHEFKYLSDSRRNWREPVVDIVKSGEYKRLHILTHAFWYETEEENQHDTIEKFVNNANRERYLQLKDNITDLESIMKWCEVQ